MLELKIEKVKQEELGNLADMAKHIWEEHYTPIIGEEQVAYMIGKFQSQEAINHQLEEGYQYYFFCYNDKHVGYLGFKISDNSLFLSKLYIEKAYHRKHIASDGVHFLENICKEQKLSKIWLTVNRYNNGSIKAYEALGFQREREEKSDIGNGYFMDDYIMGKYFP